MFFIEQVLPRKLLVGATVPQVPLFTNLKFPSSINRLPIQPTTPESQPAFYNYNPSSTFPMRHVFVACASVPLPVLLTGSYVMCETEGLLGFQLNRPWITLYPLKRSPSARIMRHNLRRFHAHLYLVRHVFLIILPVGHILEARHPRHSIEPLGLLDFICSSRWFLYHRGSGLL